MPRPVGGEFHFVDNFQFELYKWANYLGDPNPPVAPELVGDTYRQHLIVDRPQWSGGNIQALVNRYAPILKMNASDNGEYIPKDVKMWLDTGTLMDKDGNPVASAALTGSLLYRYASSEYYIDLEGDDAQELWDNWSSIEGTCDTTIYATVVQKEVGEIGENRLAIQYWFPYYCSDWKRHRFPCKGINNHEGDWEGITMILQDEDTPLLVAYAQHHGGHYRNWTSVEKVGEHPVVYVGLGGHASYFESGRSFPSIVLLNVECHKGNGNWVLPENTNVVVLPRASSISGADDPFSWIIYSGHWGEEDLPGGSFLTFANDGPTGPAFSERWLDPWEWAINIPLDSPEGELIVLVACPVDLVITDPEGRRVTKDVSEIPDTYYLESDQDGDGDPDDQVFIPAPLSGDYSIEVIPEPGAAPTDTYTLAVSYNDQPTILAQDVQIQNIPTEPYIYSASSEFSINMAEDWNLISIPVQLANTSMSVVLQSIDGLYDAIWAYDPPSGWERHVVGGLPFLNTLTDIVPSKGYWIDMSVAADLTLSGAPVENAIPLAENWNLVGFNRLTEMALMDGLESIDGYYNEVWGYDPTNGWEKYDVDGLPYLNTMVAFKSGRGYWIDAKAGCPPWDVNGGVAAPSSLPIAVKTRRIGASAPRPEIPYTIWGSVESNGVKMADGVTVFLKVDGKTQASYQLGSRAGYGDFYVLDIPASIDGSAEARLCVQVGDTVVEAAPLPPGDPGQTIGLDLSVELPPSVSMLHQNYPNPFNPDTWIPYQLNEEATVVIRIYNITGQLVRTLSLGRRPAGFYAEKAKAVHWNGRNEAGESVASGVYFYSIEAGELSVTRKMIVKR